MIPDLAAKAAGTFHVECRDKDGNLKWEEVVENKLFNGGQNLLLDVALRAGSWPAGANTGCAVGLLLNTLAALPNNQGTLASLPVSTYEPTNGSAAGYTARQALARNGTDWPTLTLAPPSTGDSQITSKQVSWTASGTWPAIRWLMITAGGATTPQDTTAVLFAAAQLSADRTLLSGDTLNVTYSLKIT